MATMTTTTCETCGAAMRQTRRGATLAKRGPSYVCSAFAFGPGAACTDSRTYQEWQIEAMRRPVATARQGDAERPFD
jgi:hypothetical protein